MDQIAFQFAKVSSWLLPVIWLGLGVWSLVNGHKIGGALLGAASLASLAWNFLFLPALAIPSYPNTFWPVVVAYEDAPLGFYLANALPLISNGSLVAALILFICRRA